MYQGTGLRCPRGSKLRWHRPVKQRSAAVCANRPVVVGSIYGWGLYIDLMRSYIGIYKDWMGIERFVSVQWRSIWFRSDFFQICMGLARRHYDLPRCFLGQSAETYPAQSACSMMLEYSPKLTQLGKDTGAVKHRALQRNKICKSNQGYHLII